MKDFFYAIQDLFVDVLFTLHDVLRATELENWWSANFISWFFIITGFTAFIYWMKQLKIFDDNDEEDKSVTAHSFL